MRGPPMYAMAWSPWLLVTALLLFSGRSAALKMYLYDLPRSLVQPPCEVQHNYHLEESLPRFLAMSPTRTLDGSNADFFVVPATPYCRKTEADMEVYTQAVLQQLRELPWWQRRGGADHVWVFSADHGFCGFTNGGAGPPAVQRSIILTHWGLDHAESPRSTHPCFHPDKDLVVPPDALLPHAASSAHHRLPGRSVHTASGTSGLSSDIMVRGLHYSHGVRQSVFLMFNDSARYPDLKLVDGRDAHWVAEMRSAVFCLAPTGGGWGIRLYVAVYHGCIPVIVQDHVYPPFHAHLPYAEFSVTVKQYTLHGLPAMLRELAADTDRIERMRTKLACVRDYLRWEFSVRAPGGRAGELLLQVLGERAAGVPPRRLCVD